MDDEQLAEIEADALAAWEQALDERAWDLAELARLEVLATQRMAACDPGMEPF